MKITLDVEYLKEEFGLPYEGYVEKKLVDTTRWGEIYNIVFEYEGKYWQFGFEQGATEMQDYDDWDYQKQVECFEVEQKEVTIKKWVQV